MKFGYVRPKMGTTGEENGHKLFSVFKFLKGDLTRTNPLEHTKPPPPPDKSSCPRPMNHTATNNISNTSNTCDGSIQTLGPTICPIFEAIPTLICDTSVVAVKGQQQRPWKRTASPGDDPLRGMTCIDSASSAAARLGEPGSGRKIEMKWRAVQLQLADFESAGTVIVCLLDESLSTVQTTTAVAIYSSIWPSGNPPAPKVLGRFLWWWCPKVMA